jgi:cell wall-associated NlpC family hydrolase
MEKIIAEANSWVGTPYHHHGRLKGVGVDCAMLLAEIFERSGIVPHVDPGVYPPQFGMHRSEERFIGFVEQYGLEVDSPVAGGVVLFRYGRCFSHGGVIVENGLFVHAVLKAGMVLKSGLNEPEYLRHDRKFYEVCHGR